MRDEIENLQGQIAELANTIQGVVLEEFPDGYQNAVQQGKEKQKVYCIALDQISSELQLLTAKAGKIIERIDKENG